MFATKLTDLDDFITPTQECVKMILPSAESGSTAAKLTLDQDDAEWKIDTKAGKPDLIKAKGEA